MDWTPPKQCSRQLDPDARCERLVGEGVWREPGEHTHGGDGTLALPVPRGGDAPPALPVLRVEGSARALLTGERTALNFLGHLSGVATMAARAARAVEGTGARVLDTRKTTPGLRALEKAAVAAGGAHNHRAGLLRRDPDQGEPHRRRRRDRAGGRARACGRPGAAATLEVEVRNPEEIEQALAVGAPRLLLDNMDDRTAARRGGPGCRARAAGGQRRGDAADAPGAGADRGRMDLDGRPHPLGARARPLHDPRRQLP